MTSEDFNTYFSNVAPDIDKQFPNDTDNFEWKGSDCKNTFIFAPFTVEKIQQELLNLDNSPNLDILGMDRKLLRLSAPIVSDSLCKIFNASISQKFVHIDFKTARVTPVFKNGEDSDIFTYSDYRPISVICHIAKIFEKLVKMQLLTFLDANNLISNDKSAYLKNHSTQTSLHRVMEDWLENINEGEFTGACIFDISKCFDTINHKHLLYKLEKYGIRGASLDWFKSYLSNRRQAVSSNGKISAFKELFFGVPQGSILGPFLFLLFINDIQNFATNGCSINMFADDLILYCSDTCIINLRSKLQNAVDSICNWYKRNRLKVNPKKSKLMVLNTKRQLAGINRNNFSIQYDGADIPLVDKATYLGLIIKNDLSWEKNISELCRNLNFKVYQLKQLRKSGHQSPYS